MDNLNIQILSFELNKPQKAGGKEKAKKSGGDVDVMALAFLLLIDLAMMTNETARIQAKRMQSNAADQRQINNQEEKLQYQSVPKLEIHHHVKREKKEIPNHNPRGGPIYVTKTIKWTTSNSNVVDPVIAKNQETAGERQLLSQKMSVLENEGNMAGTKINTLVGESAQTMQEGDAFMQALRSLTFKALMRPPVQT